MLQNLTGSAERANEGKPQLSYLLGAPRALEGLTRRFELGTMKYSRDNWKAGFPEDRLLDSLMRHIFAYAKGQQLEEEFDKEGKSMGMHPTVDAIVWNAIVLSEQWHKNRETAVG